MTETPGTNSFQFTRTDVEELTLALSEMAVRNHLPKEQWGLLLSIFAAAADHVEVGVGDTEGTFSEVGVQGAGVIEDPEGEDVETLRNQLRNAYLPATPPHRPFGDMVNP
jgi:hypothetical protein